MSFVRNSSAGSTVAENPLLEETYDDSTPSVAAEGDQVELSRRLLSRVGRGTASFFMAAKVDLISVLFILSGVLSGFVLRLRMSENPFYHKAFLLDMAVFSFLAAVGFFIRRSRRPIYYVTVSLLFSCLLIFDTVYFRSHTSVLSLFLLHQLQFLPQVSDAAVALISWGEIIYPLITILLLGAVVVLSRRGYFAPRNEGGRCRRRKTMTMLMVAALVFGAFSIFMTKTEASRLTKQWNRPYLVEHFGVYAFHLSDFIKFVGSSHGMSEIDQESYDKVLGLYEQRIGETRRPNEYTGLLAGQNLVVIHAESVQSMFLNAEIEGREITPTLNKLASQGFYFSDFHAQQSSGTSSDSEFTFNTSLYPIHNGTVFISHFNNTFNTVPKMLKDKGYSAIALHGNHRNFWNRDVMNRNLGYDNYYGKKDFELDEVMGMGLSDVSFFRQGAEIIGELQQPFMATFITLTNHTPFPDEDKYGELAVGEFEGKRFGRYLKSLRYADEAIGRFMEDLDRRGILDETTILIYGDHPANLSKDDTASFLGSEDFDGYDHRRAKSVPLIIWSKRIDRPREVDQPMGMLDVAPTLGNMMSFENPFSLGKDIFTTDKNVVAFPDGSWIDREVFYSSASMSYKVYDEELRREVVLEACGVDPGTLVDPILIEQLECTRDHQRGVFHLNGDESIPPGPAAKLLRERVLSTIVRLRRDVEVSDLILEYDLLREKDEQHKHSIASLAP